MNMYLKYSAPGESAHSYCPVEVVYDHHDPVCNVAIILQDGMYGLARSCSHCTDLNMARADMMIQRIAFALSKGLYADFDNGVEGLSIQLVPTPED